MSAKSRKEKTPGPPGVFVRTPDKHKQRPASQTTASDDGAALPFLLLLPFLRELPDGENAS